ncbi:Endo-1,4-beta-xylanase [Handroanthus impetiginosus]|uniref:Endo-1,4-beta-xylanase n=1 Tax=Handroanthus impetiginosus TaxID=429701 RepID=A0A2G9GDC0_9LAMI|nr:Endo-1,4-beta-xylanase [Handroanthus impetiginosus]
MIKTTIFIGQRSTRLRQHDLNKSNYQAHVLPYDYSFTHECLAKPLKPQYGGGIAINPELDKGLKGWTQSCDAKVEHHQQSNGNNYLAASIISANQTSTIKKFHLEEDKLYTFSAWFQVSKGNAYIQAIFMTHTDNITAGWVATQQGCWTMLKGGLVVNVTGLAELYFRSHDINSTAQIWVDNISLQPFTHQEWKSDQDQSIEKYRKSKLKFHVVDQQNRPVPDATISMKQTRLSFLFGNAISGYILNSTAYQNWFASQFKYTVFENEMKWYLNEQTRGIVDYSVTDAMLQFAKSHRIAERIGENSSATYYKKAHEIDPDALLFLNEYMTLEKRAFWSDEFALCGASIDVLDSANRLDQVIRELHSHHAVQGILIWSAISPEGCWKMCLTDQNFDNLDTGDVVDKFIAEWTHSSGLEGKTDSNGYFETSLFHAQYEANLRLGKKPILQKFEVAPNGDGKHEEVVFKIFV